MSLASSFVYIRQLVQDHCGVVLEPEKEYLMTARLQPQLKSWGLSNLEEMTAHLLREPTGDLMRLVSEALVPNETYFFRDPSFYQALETTVIPGIIARNGDKKELHIWSAACSSGQEPYSVAMLIRTHFPQLLSWKLQIIASDISQTIVARTRQGLYSQLEVNRGLPAVYLARYFSRQADGWHLSDDIRHMVTPHVLDLRTPWPWAGGFDLILARNVLIYFDIPTKQEILGRFRHLLKPSGYLFLGSSETTLFLDPHFVNVPIQGVIGNQRKG
jgi:chemotaxis protein methyltransferase CheR